MRRRVVKALRPLHAISIENGAGAGTPDVNYTGGWLELKSMAEWPSDPINVLEVPHFTAQQRLWLRKRHLAGGRVHMLLKVANDWLLIEGWHAAVHVGKSNRAMLIDVAERAWVGGLKEKELLEALRCSRKT